jgi:SAM-dependent methyltransferase
MARWTRAIQALPFKQGRVLDLGCAFGFATRRLARRGYETVGVDASPAYIARARRAHPQGTYLLAEAEAVPLPDHSFDGVLFLDVLEHVHDERAALAEIARLLKPGGTLIVSVPHRGLLWRLDSLNLYQWLVRRTHHGLPPPEIGLDAPHRHYRLTQLQEMLGARFRLERVMRTGLGLAELVNVPLLVFCRSLLGWEWLYQILQYIYFTVYLLEDVAPLGPLGYHMMVVATRVHDSS